MKEAIAEHYHQMCSRKHCSKLSPDVLKRRDFPILSPDVIDDGIDKLFDWMDVPEEGITQYFDWMC